MLKKNDKNNNNDIYNSINKMYSSKNVVDICIKIMNIDKRK